MCVCVRALASLPVFVSTCHQHKVYFDPNGAYANCNLSYAWACTVLWFSEVNQQFYSVPSNRRLDNDKRSEVGHGIRNAFQHGSFWLEEERIMSRDELFAH